MPSFCCLWRSPAMMEDAGTWGTLCGFFSPTVTLAALGTLCSVLLPLLSRASSASVTLQSPGRGIAVCVALLLRRLLWLWSHSGGHGLVVLKTVIHKHPETKLATGLRLAGNNCRDLSVYNHWLSLASCLRARRKYSPWQNDFFYCQILFF